MKFLPLVLFVAGCASAASASSREEIVAVPGTDLRLEMVYVPGTAAVRPF